MVSTVPVIVRGIPPWLEKRGKRRVGCPVPSCSRYIPAPVSEKEARSRSEEYNTGRSIASR
jgi:hypothetical protein